MTESTANPLDMLLQQGRNAVNGAQYSIVKAPGVLWGVCVIIAVNGASFIGTASAATPPTNTDAPEYLEAEDSVKQAAYSAAHAQLQAAENYCLRDKIAFLVKQGFVQAPVVAESTAEVGKVQQSPGSAEHFPATGVIYTAKTEEECAEDHRAALEAVRETAAVDKAAEEGVAHLSARAAEELKAEVLAEDFLKQQEV